MSATDPMPDEVLQQETKITTVPPVPVTVEGPIHAQQLPGRTRWAMGALTITTTLPQQLVGDEPRRKRLVVTTATSAAFLSDSEAGASSNRRFRLPSGSPVELTHTGEVWALGDGGNAEVSWFMEFWSD